MNFIIEIIWGWRTCRRRNAFWRAAAAATGGAGGSSAADEIIQVHHDIAFEPHDLAAVENPELVGGERSVQQFDVDMLVRRHRSLVHVDIGLRHPRFIAGGGLQEDILAQVEHLLLAVEISGAGVHRDRALVFHHHLGAQRLEFDMIGVGQILDRGLGPHFVWPLVGREAGEMRRFHRDLGAGNHEIAHVDAEVSATACGTD